MGWQMADECGIHVYNTCTRKNVFLETRSNPNAVANFIHSSGSPSTRQTDREREKIGKNKENELCFDVFPAHGPNQSPARRRPFLAAVSDRFDPRAKLFFFLWNKVKAKLYTFVCTRHVHRTNNVMKFIICCSNFNIYATKGLPHIKGGLPETDVKTVIDGDVITSDRT